MNSLWSQAGNWADDLAGTDTGATPAPTDTLIFNTNTVGFANNFSADNDVAALTGISIEFVDDSAAGDFTLGGAQPVQLAANGISHGGTDVTATTIDTDLTLGADAVVNNTVGSTSDSLFITGNINVGANRLRLAGLGRTSVNGVISGASGVTTAGGTVTLGAANTYVGTTDVESGTLLVNGSTAGGMVTVQSGGTLGGNGNAAGSVLVQSGGAVAPGVSPGTITTGALTLDNGSTLAIEIDAPGATAGTDYDEIQAAGDVRVDDVSFQLAGTEVPVLGDEYIIVANNSLNPVIRGATAPAQGSVVGQLNGVSLQIDYEAGDGNDIALLATTSIITADNLAAGTGGDGTPDTFTVRRNGADVEVLVNGGVVFSAADAVVPVLRIKGSTDDDTLVVDHSGGVVGADITYDGDGTNLDPTNTLTANPVPTGPGFDQLQVTGGQFNTVTYSVGPLVDEGRVTYDDDDDASNGVVNTIDFVNLEPVQDNVVAANVVVNGTNGDNAITYIEGPGGGIFVGTTGLVSIDDFETLEFEGKQSLTINALSGSDTVVLNHSGLPLNLENVVVNGSNGNDSISVLNLPDAGATTFNSATLNGGDSDDVIDASTLTQATPLTIRGNGGNDTLSGGAGADSLLGGLGNDSLIDSPGSDTYDGADIAGGVSDTITSTSGIDTLIIRGTPGNDLINVIQDAPSAVAGSNYPLGIALNAAANTQNLLVQNAAGAPNALPVMPTVEEVRVEGGDGNDTIQVAHHDVFTDGAAGGAPQQMVRFSVDGGNPNASDQLFVVDDGTGDLVLVRQGVDDRSGRVTVAPAVNTTSQTGFRGDIVYTGIENVDVTPINPITGGSGTGGGGRVLIFEPDPFESNDNRLIASDLGTLTRTSRSPTIDPGSTTLNPLFPAANGDEDWYEFTANQAGTVKLDTLFTSIASVGSGRAGLPANGALATAIYTVAGGATPIAVGSTLTNSSGVGIGQSLQFAVVPNTSYFLRVTGAPLPGAAVSSSAAINTYEVSVSAEADELGPQITGLSITGSTFDPLTGKTAGGTPGPTPSVTSLTVAFRDPVSATQLGQSPGATLGAVDAASALAPANYSLVGKNSGPIPVTNVSFAIPPTPTVVSGATVAAGAPQSANTFRGTGGAPALSAVPGFYVGRAVQFTSGPLSGQARVISGYTGGANPIFAFSTPFTGSPATGNAFDIVPGTPSPTSSNVTSSTSASLFSGTAALSSVDGFYNGQILQFTGGALTGQAQRISAYIGSTRTFIVESPFTATPVAAAATTFDILPINVAAVTLEFSGSIPDDQYTLTISDSITDAAGNALDGENNGSFPTGNFVSGGDFVAQFTTDSRAELGVWSGGSVYVDTNGNFTFDPNSADPNNSDVVYTLGLVTDFIFVGNFSGPGPDGTYGTADDRAAAAGSAIADGFDKLAAYGRVGGPFRTLVDFTNDGVPDQTLFEATDFNGVGVPVAGNFDGFVDNGDEIGVFTGTEWIFDRDRNFSLSNDTRIASTIRGRPIVGDFDGNGMEDLGTYDALTNTFRLILNPNLDGPLPDPTHEFRLGNGFAFSGARDRPVAGDVDGDGLDDIGLWVPDRSGVIPEEAAEWYFLVSAGSSVTNRIQNENGTNVINFSSVPFGNDLFAQFGDGFAIPIVGNFDPPVGGASGANTPVPATPPDVGTEEEEAPIGDSESSAENAADEDSTNDGSEEVPNVEPAAEDSEPTDTSASGEDSADEPVEEEVNTSPTVSSSLGQLVVSEDASIASIDLANVFSDDGPLSYQIVEQSDPTLISASIEADALQLRTFPNANGSATVVIEARDSADQVVRDTLALTVTPENDAPVVVAPTQVLSLSEDQPALELDLNAFFIEADADPLDFTILPSSGADDLVDIELRGSLLRVAPLLNANGSSEVMVRATDPRGLSTTTSVRVNVQAVNDAPVALDPLQQLSVQQGSDPQQLDLDELFRDVDGDSLRYQVNAPGGSLLSTQLIDSALTLMFASDEFGRATLGVTATDPSGRQAELELQVVVEQVEQEPEVEDTSPVDQPVVTPRLSLRMFLAR